MADKKKQGADRGELLQRLNRVIRESVGLGTLFGQAVARRIGVGATDLECLDVILLRGSLTAGEIAEATGLTTGAVTGLIDRLEHAGLARRERDAADRRKVYVKPTPKAAKAGAAYYGSFQREMKRLSDRYSDEQIGHFIDYFTRSGEVIRREIDRLGAAEGKTGRTGRR
jgi:DNA-binding MarR family transcriptional regulator